MTSLDSPAAEDYGFIRLATQNLDEPILSCRFSLAVETCLLIEQFSHAALEYREIAIDDVPNDFEFHCEVAMDQTIARGGDFTPRKIWRSLLQVIRQTLRGFADYLQLPDHGALRLLVSHEGGTTISGKPFDALNRFGNVLQVETISILHTGRASERIRTFICG